MSTLYREDILEHARNPHHRGKLEPADINASLANTTCGDEIILSLRVNDEKTVDEIKFEGRGCIISQAAADMFAEYIFGKKIKEITKIVPANILALFGAPITPSRQTCALLAYEALRRQLGKQNT